MKIKEGHHYRTREKIYLYNIRKSQADTVIYKYQSIDGSGMWDENGKHHSSSVYDLVMEIDKSGKDLFCYCGNINIFGHRANCPKKE